MRTGEEIKAVLNAAQELDKNCELFGAPRHRYALNPPAEKAYVRELEERYGFRLPKDYFHFITEIGDGGAGPDYGLSSFTAFFRTQASPKAEAYASACRGSLSKPFSPRPMGAEEVENYAIVTKERYRKHPERYFICDEFEDEGLTHGFLVLGTHGCQWDFGLAVTGDRRGQIFDMDNEGGYGFTAGSFAEFYESWLEFLSDGERFRKELERWQQITR